MYNPPSSPSSVCKDAIDGRQSKSWCTAFRVVINFSISSSLGGSRTLASMKQLIVATCMNTGIVFAGADEDSETKKPTPGDRPEVVRREWCDDMIEGSRSQMDGNAGRVLLWLALRRSKLAWMSGDLRCDR